jgi:hypothetical protein
MTETSVKDNELELLKLLIKQSQDKDKRIEELEGKLGELLSKFSNESSELSDNRVHNKTIRTIALSQMPAPINDKESYNENYPQLKPKTKELLERASKLIVEYAKAVDPSKFG